MRIQSLAEEQHRRPISNYPIYLAYTFSCKLLASPFVMSSRARVSLNSIHHTLLNCSHIPIEHTIVNSRRCKIRISLLEVRDLRQGSRELRHNLADRSRMICEPVSGLEGFDQMPQL